MFYNRKMSLHARRALFYSLFLLFIVLGIGVSLYAEGWRIDLSTLHINKVGGIYVRSYPENAEILLNGKPIENQSGFLSRGTLISDLFPKSYLLKLTAPGYLDWHESATVLPAFVVNHKYAVLVPHDDALFASTTANHILQSHGVALLETTQDGIEWNGKNIGTGKLINASPDLQTVLFETTKGARRFWNATNGVATTITATGTLLLDPSNNNLVIAANSQSITVTNGSNGSNERIEKAPLHTTIAPSIAVSPSTIAWALATTSASSSSIFFYDRSSKTMTDPNLTIKGRIKQLTWVTSSILGVLADDGSLFLYDTGTKRLTKTADHVTRFDVTNDGTRIAALEKESLEIFSLNDPEGYYRFNLPNVANVEKTLWFRDHDHLFIVYPDRIAFLDLQDAGLANFTTVSFGTAPTYDADTNILSLIDSRSMPVHFDFAK
jgi:hypothetical protein